MRRFTFTLLLLLILLFAGCRTEQNPGSGVAQNPDSGVAQGVDSGNISSSEKTAYRSDTSPEDCMLCGGGIQDQIPSQWGQNNIALISLNSFDVKPIEINRYDGGQLIEAFAGFGSIGGGAGKNGGFSASLMENYDRGYAIGSVYFNGDEMLDTGKAAGFLCEDCLNEILPRQAGRCFGVGAVDLATGDVRIFAENLGGFTLGDFYINCDLREEDGDQPRMDLLIFYCPIRYEKQP